MMPGFYKNMPADEPGLWVACSIRWSPRRGDVETCLIVQGLKRAYIMARLLALWDDISCPDSWQEIRWAVRPLNSQEKSLIH